MASSKPQSLIIYGAFYLPIVSLALLTGFLVSLALPVALAFSISALESTVFVVLPQLWYGLLSWITPPCLFVLLNGIIVVLTASSGVLSSSSSCADAFDCYARPLGKSAERSRRESSGALMEEFSAGVSSANLPAKMQKHTSPDIAGDAPALCTHRPCAVLDARGMRQVENGEFHDAEEGAEEEEEEEEEREAEAEEERAEEEEQEEGEKKEEDIRKLSRLSMESRSSSFRCAAIRISEEDEEIDDVYDNGPGWPSRRDSKAANINKKSSFFCREEGDHRVRMNSSTEFATSPKANSIKRSLSVDSASLVNGNQAPALPSAESLSEEAFRRRVEDFISRMNAQMRNEVQ